MASDNSKGEMDQAEDNEEMVLEEETYRCEVAVN